MALIAKIILFLYLINQVICGGPSIVAKNENTTDDNSTHETAKAINNFGYNFLLTMMKQNVNENVVLSPVSVAGLLGMTLLGTVGKTYQELATALGFSQDIVENRKNHDQFGQLLKSLNENTGTSKTLYANTIFVDEFAKLRDMYRSYLSYAYNSEVHSVNFTKGVEVKNQINEWVNSHTMNKIKNFLDKPLPRDTKVVLLSALYFSGQWERPFLPRYTSPMPFYTPNKEVTIDQMINKGQFKYLLSGEYGMHMIALPYNDSTTTFYAMKPYDSSELSLLTLMERLDSDKIDQLINNMAKRKCIIRIPKMDVRGKANLEKALKSMGVNALFKPSEANFALMVDDRSTANKTEDEILARIYQNPEMNVHDVLNSLPNPGIYVDSVLHDVRLSINEFGTEAVAATASLLARTAKLFYADSPFYMFIRNEQTKLITFSAAIFDPTA